MNKLKKNIINIYGREGETWLKLLQSNVDKICSKYHVLNISPVDNMTFNYVASGFINKKPIMIKYGLNQAALAKEAACLKAFSCYGGIEYIADEANLIIMERAMPGDTLKHSFPSEDEKGTSIMCHLLQKLHKAPISKHNNFYHLHTLYQVFDKFDDLPKTVLNQACQLRNEMFSKRNKKVLLHGDLHHDNIIKHKDNYVVIDPKGFIGDPLYDVAAFIINPIPDLLDNHQVKHLIRQRIEICSSILGASEKDITKWTYLKALLCWIWVKQDNLDDDYFERMTYLLEEL
jgi:streptomycin 6-kinase